MEESPRELEVERNWEKEVVEEEKMREEFAEWGKSMKEGGV